MTHTEYTNLFLGMARDHRDIRHLNPDTRFARIIGSPDPMFRTLHLQEFMALAKAKLEYPCLLVETYVATYEEDYSDQVWRNHAGAFYVLVKPSKSNDFDAINEALDKAEHLAEDCVGYLHQYAYNRPGEMNFRSGDVAMSKVGPVGTNMVYGVRVDFEFQSAANEGIAYKPTQFVLEP